MLVVGIDTSGPTAGAALVREGELLAEVWARGPGRATGALLPAIDAALRAAGATVREVRGVACSAGPGSYTGLRTGLASAKALAAALGVPLALVPTLEAAAASCGPWPWPVAAAVADRGRFAHAAVYRWEGARVRLVEDAGAVDLEAWGPTLARYDGPILLAGPAAPALARCVPEGAGGAAPVLVPPHLRVVRPAAVALLGEERIAGGRTEDPLRALPAYGGEPRLGGWRG
jgi:tRNA threonylcarbamoyladenosine biosynthesis protein TsaB